MTDVLQGKKVLITGGAGFIGSALARRMLQEGCEVVCLDDLSTGFEKNLEEHKNNPDFKFVQGDANDLEAVRAVFDQDKFNYVFHYAARVGVIRTIEHPLEVMRDIEGIKNVLKLSQERGVEKVMFSSSSEVYGEPVEIPEREDGHLNPKLPYAVVKLAGETYLKSYGQEHGLKTCSLRFFNVYGPGQDSSAYGFVAGIFIKQALAGKPITIFGDGTQTRDFVYIDDNIEATVQALLSDKTDGEVLNIGTGRPTTILDLAERVKEMVGKPSVEIKHTPPRASGEVRHRFPDVSKLKKLLGYHARTSLDEGLKKTIEWHSKRSQT